MHGSDNDIDYVDDGVAGSVLVNSDPAANKEFNGVRSNEFEASFDCLPADKGYMYFEPGTIWDRSRIVMIWDRSRKVMIWDRSRIVMMVIC